MNKNPLSQKTIFCQDICLSGINGCVFIFIEFAISYHRAPKPCQSKFLWTHRKRRRGRSNIGHYCRFIFHFALNVIELILIHENFFGFYFKSNYVVLLLSLVYPECFIIYSAWCHKNYRIYIDHFIHLIFNDLN